MLPETLTFVDVETTGMRPTWDRVIEIGMIRVEKGVVTRTFESLVNPGYHLPPEITTITGLSSEDLKDAPSFWEIRGDILEMMEEAVFVAHNVRFDYSFLKNEFKRLESSFAPKHFCTAKLSRYLYSRYRHHSVEALIQRFGFEPARRHRALADAQVIWEFFQKAREESGQAKFEAAVTKALKKPTVPLRLAPEEMEALPEAPGVYIFYGDKGAPLYVGKSKNLKDRVKTHFASDHLSGKEMKIAQQVSRVETIRTSGELGALLLESALVKKMQPLYNRMLRYSQGLLVLTQVEDEAGFATIKASQMETLRLEELDKLVGVFKSRKQMNEWLHKLAGEFGLCERVLGIEKTLSHCFGYRLGKCLGACAGKEIPLKYNLRFAQAFADSRIRPWPFSGAVVITEEDPEEGTQEAFVVDKWCFLGKYVRQEGADMDQSKEELRFDLDVYKIIASYLNNPKNHKNIQPLAQMATAEVELV